jgi:hypothetical protein
MTADLIALECYRCGSMVQIEDGGKPGLCDRCGDDDWVYAWIDTPFTFDETATKGEPHAEDETTTHPCLGQHRGDTRTQRRHGVGATAQHLTDSRGSGATPSTPSPNVASGSRNPFCPMRGRRGLSCTQTLPRDLWCWSCERWAPA